MNKKSKFSISFLINPFWLYILSIGGSLGIYSLKWSYYYHDWSSRFILFASLTMCMSLILTQLPILRTCSKFRHISICKSNSKWFKIIWLCFILEFIFYRQIPLISVAFGGIGNYKDFTGFPFFHALFVMISNFWGIYWYLQYCSNPTHKTLRKYAFMMILLQILLLNRGGCIITIITYCFIYIIKNPTIGYKNIFKVCISVVIIVTIFGWLGNSRDARSRTDEDFIMKIGGANQKYVESGMPNSLFWIYLYMSSPIGNIQNAMEVSDIETSTEGLFDTAIENGLPDFLKKRIKGLMFKEEVDSDYYLVSINFNAPSVFFDPYLRAGSGGMIAMYFFIVLVTLGYAYIMPKNSPYFLIGWVANLSSIALCSFNNMWAFGSLQVIILPIAIDFFEKLSQKWKGHLYQS